MEEALDLSFDRLLMMMYATKIFFLKNKNKPKKLKLRLKNTIIDKTLTYVSETWTLTKRERKQLNIFERKVYRRILGPVKIKKKLEDINQ